ncbi:glutamine amidotransferase [Methylocapsa sp. D3K7]|uniref:glutamine amidotransferase n=1 Tax=Methylocapsa sp. D3K7 TaxID=3041435 RepID=UPI00244EFE27|nr:glutamine amidotransferase [Methylocapsa sp. D3K7]WGJ13352.1 glutamine amidotransferase [Methylocapsa sp. D3K7]
MKTAAVIRHVPFEDLGTIAEPLMRAGYDYTYSDIGHALPSRDPADTDLLIVLGGPIGVYEDDKYPFLRDEIAILSTRLNEGKPTLGICLGAQLIACALGAKVYPSGVKEIGWGPVDLTKAAAATPLRHLANTAVLHWHGDTFDLPPGAMHLASTPACRNQAFCIGPNILGLQFHPEVNPSAGIEAWLVGHAAELTGAGIDPRALRSGGTAGSSLPAKARDLFAEWLTGLQP